MLKFRDYQSEAIDASLCFLMNQKSKDNGIVILPTGSGKSLVIAGISYILDEPILVFQPSKEILEQNYKKLLDYGAFDISIFSASMNRKRISKITLATIGSAKNNVELFKHFKYVIVDECDLVNPYDGMYRDFFATIKCKVLGLTATPWRMATTSEGTEHRFLTRMRPVVFKEVIYCAQIQTMVDRNYWSKLEYYQISGFDSSQLVPTNNANGYSDESIRKYYEEIKFNNKLIRVIDRLKDIRKNMLVFTQFVEEAQILAKMYGDIAATISGTTPKKEREEILTKFQRGQIKIVTNVGVLTAGFDFPELETVVIAKPTRSLRLYYQINGRGTRPHPLKESCWLVDMCDNYKMFGKLEDITIEKEDGYKWIVKNQTRQLTNVYI